MAGESSLCFVIHVQTCVKGQGPVARTVKGKQMDAFSGIKNKPWDSTFSVLWTKQVRI